MPAEKAERPIKLMTLILGVSRSGLCSRLSSGCPEDDWSAERKAVRRVRLEPDRRFGARFVKRFLPEELSGLTLYRVRKLMREPGIRGRTPNRRKRAAIPDPKAKPRPDLVRRDFTSPVPTYKLVGGIPYLRTGEGWPCLPTVIDLNTRVVVGRSLSERMTADIMASAPAFARSRGYWRATPYSHRFFKSHCKSVPQGQKLDRRLGSNEQVRRREFRRNRAENRPFTKHSRRVLPTICP